MDIPKTYNNGYTAKAFVVAGTSLWNNILNDELLRRKNVELFKNKLKTLHFRSFYLSVLLFIHFNIYVRLFPSILLCFLCHCTLYYSL